MSRRLLLCLCLALASCGYHTGGKADLIPKNIKTVAIPPFLTATTRYKLVDSLPQAIAKEFLTRTRYRIVNDPSEADAVLSGRILNVTANPNVLDPTSGQSISVRVSVALTLNFVERSTGKVLFTRANWNVHQDYAAAFDPHQLFDESGVAFQRLNRDLARDLVSAIVENF